MKKIFNANKDASIEEKSMKKVLVLYYSSYGHIEAMANAVAEGAESVENVENVDVTLKIVPELMPEEVAKNAGVKLDQAADIAQPSELADYDAIIFGKPHVLVIWLRKCVTSLTKQVVYGLMAN